MVKCCTFWPCRTWFQIPLLKMQDPCLLQASPCGLSSAPPSHVHIMHAVENGSNAAPNHLIEMDQSDFCYKMELSVCFYQCPPKWRKKPYAKPGQHCTQPLIRGTKVECWQQCLLANQITPFSPSPTLNLIHARDLHWRTDSTMSAHSRLDNRLQQRAHFF